MVLLGGSHDSTYSTVRGLFDASGGQAVGDINFDAHAYVKDKPEISSGTPFGKLLREGFLRGEGFTKFGLHSNLNTKQDIDFLHQQQARVVPLVQVQKDGMAHYLSRALARATATGPVFVSFDIDGCAEAGPQRRWFYAPASGRNSFYGRPARAGAAV